jgi:5-methylcytosine-specific restriction endonuclease McrA
MGIRRQPREIWRVTRRKVWERDEKKCVRCGKAVALVGSWRKLTGCHIDHIKSGMMGTNKMSNLRTLCVLCHATREDRRHRALTMRLVREGLLPPDWHGLTWAD